MQFALRDGRRRMAHFVAITVVVFGMLACHRGNQGASAVANLPAGDPEPMESTAALPAVLDPIEVPTPGLSKFAPNVERWRSLSRESARTVQRETGVNLGENILLALVAVESEGKPTMRSPRGAIGLTQVEPATFEDLRGRYGKWLGTGSLEQPRVNLLAGAFYLADCARVLGANVADPEDLILVLHAYNMGPRAAAEWRETGEWLNETERGTELVHGLPAETADHAARILAALYAHGG